MFNRSHRRSQLHRRQTHEDAVAETNSNSGYSNDGRIPRYLDGSSIETRYSPSVNSSRSSGDTNSPIRRRRRDGGHPTSYQDMNSPLRRVAIEEMLGDDDDPPRYEDIYPESHDTTEPHIGYTNSGGSKERPLDRVQRRYQSRSRSSRSNNSSNTTSSSTTTGRNTSISMSDTIFTESELDFEFGPGTGEYPLNRLGLDESPISTNSSSSEIIDDSNIYNPPNNNHVHVDHHHPRFTGVVHIKRPTPLFVRSRTQTRRSVPSHPYFPGGYGTNQYSPIRPYGYPNHLMNRSPVPISIISEPQENAIFYQHEQQKKEDEEEKSTARTTEFYPPFPIDLPPSNLNPNLNPYAIADIDWNFPEGDRFLTGGFGSHLDQQPVSGIDLSRPTNDISFSGGSSSITLPHSHSSAANLPSNSNSNSPSINLSINLSISSPNPNEVADTLSKFSLGLRNLSDSLRDR